MGTRKVVLVVSGLIVSLVVVANWGQSNQTDLQTDVQENSDDEVLIEEVEAPGTYYRNEEGNLDPAQEPLPYWRDVEGFQEDFLNRFLDKYITQNGEEEQVLYVQKITEEMKTADNWEAVSMSIASAIDSGMAVDPAVEAIYSDLLMPEYYAVSNLLHSQRMEYLRWSKDSSTGHVHMRGGALERYPLNYPPEVHFAMKSGLPNGWEYSKDLLTAAALLRENAVREYASYELEKFIMLRALEETLLYSNVTIPIDEKEDAYAEMVPSFRNVQEATDGIEMQYMNALGDLLSSYSSEIPEAE